MASLLKTFNTIQLFSKCLKRSADVLIIPNRTRICPKPKKRHPEWLPKPQRVMYDEALTPENKEFLSEFIASTKGLLNFDQKSPLCTELVQSVAQWSPKSKRTGLIGKKIGVYPMWLKNGQRVLSTLIQIVDNEVVKYISPEQFNPVITKYRQIEHKNGCLIVGAENIDPQLLTKEYYGIFSTAGVTPKKTLRRFIISTDAVLQPGTPLCAAHFKPGEFVDIRGKTIDRGFQGVMKRWGFKGMPASHGVTKTHRKPGNIGSGGQKARVMPGTKLPGHMGNRWRVLRGVKILRINTKYNVIWVLGPNVPGETNSVLYLYDTILPHKRNSSPNFPTYLSDIDEDSLPEDLYADDVHQFKDPTIEFTPES